MPYDIAIGSIAQVRFQGTCDGQLFISLFHYMFTDGPLNPNGGQMLLDLMGETTAANSLLPKYLNCLGPDIVDVEQYAQWITPTRYVPAHDPNGPYVGANANNTRTANIATAITKKGQLASRHSIGTLHMPGVPDNMIDNGKVSPGGLIDLQALADKIKTVYVLVGGRTMTPIIFNRTNPDLSVPIEVCLAQTTLRCSRRRTVGLGA